MRIIIAWIVASLVIAYFGRRRTGGFWGMLFFSLILSPLLGLLALIIAGPSKKALAEQRSERIRVEERTRTTGTAPASGTAGVSPERSIWRTFAGPWILLVVVFALLYWITAGAGRQYGAFAYALSLSVEAGTLGLVGGGDHVPHGTVRFLAAVQRMGVLLILAAVVVRLAARRQDRALLRVHAAGEETAATIHTLEASVEQQRHEIERLRASARTSPDAPSAAPPDVRPAGDEPVPSAPAH